MLSSTHRWMVFRSMCGVVGNPMMHRHQQTPGSRLNHSLERSQASELFQKLDGIRLSFPEIGRTTSDLPPAVAQWVQLHPNVVSCPRAVLITKAFQLEQLEEICEGLERDRNELLLEVRNLQSMAASSLTRKPLAVVDAHTNVHSMATSPMKRPPLSGATSLHQLRHLSEASRELKQVLAREFSSMDSWMENMKVQFASLIQRQQQAARKRNSSHMTTNTSFQLSDEWLAERNALIAELEECERSKSELVVTCIRLEGELSWEKEMEMEKEREREKAQNEGNQQTQMMLQELKEAMETFGGLRQSGTPMSKVGGSGMSELEVQLGSEATKEVIRSMAVAYRLLKETFTRLQQHSDLVPLLTTGRSMSEEIVVSHEELIQSALDYALWCRKRVVGLESELMEKATEAAGLKEQLNHALVQSSAAATEVASLQSNKTDMERIIRELRLNPQAPQPSKVFIPKLDTEKLRSLSVSEREESGSTSARSHSHRHHHRSGHHHVRHGLSAQLTASAPALSDQEDTNTITDIDTPRRLPRDETVQSNLSGASGSAISKRGIHSSSKKERAAAASALEDTISEMVGRLQIGGKVELQRDILLTDVETMRHSNMTLTRELREEKDMSRAQAAELSEVKRALAEEGFKGKLAQADAARANARVKELEQMMRHQDIHAEFALHKESLLALQRKQSAPDIIEIEAIVVTLEELHQKIGFLERVSGVSKRIPQISSPANDGGESWTATEMDDAYLENYLRCYQDASDLLGIVASVRVWIRRITKASQAIEANVVSRNRQEADTDGRATERSDVNGCRERSALVLARLSECLMGLRAAFIGATKENKEELGATMDDLLKEASIVMEDAKATLAIQKDTLLALLSSRSNPADVNKRRHARLKSIALASGTLISSRAASSRM
jgi:hypothetical protein